MARTVHMTANTPMPTAKSATKTCLHPMVYAMYAERMGEPIWPTLPIMPLMPKARPTDCLKLQDISLNAEGW